MPGSNDNNGVNLSTLLTAGVAAGFASGLFNLLTKSVPVEEYTTSTHKGYFTGGAWGSQDDKGSRDPNTTYSSVTKRSSTMPLASFWARRLTGTCGISPDGIPSCAENAKVLKELFSNNMHLTNEEPFQPLVNHM